MAGGVAQGEGPEFKPQYHKKKPSPEGFRGPAEIVGWDRTQTWTS
jgi:hypothetical protein